jgi:hypothetical protein
VVVSHEPEEPASERVDGVTHDPGPQRRTLDDVHVRVGATERPDPVGESGMEETCDRDPGRGGPGLEQAHPIHDEPLGLTEIAGDDHDLEAMGREPAAEVRELDLDPARERDATLAHDGIEVLDEQAHANGPAHAVTGPAHPPSTFGVPADMAHCPRSREICSRAISRPFR